MKQERFKQLVKLAEKYIEENLGEALGHQINCYEYINSKYKPEYAIKELETKSLDELKKILLKRFALHLQNQYSMPKIINYKENYERIDCIILNFKRKTHNRIKLTENLFEEFKNLKLISKTSEKTWKRYSKGLIDALSYVNEIVDVASYIEELKCINEKPFDEKQYYLDDIKNKVYGIGDTMKYDFYKELCCFNLIKPDVHIKDLLHNIKNPIIDETNDNNLAGEFIKMCSKLEHKTPYYVDKIFWLACTGNFYNEGFDNIKEMDKRKVNKKNFRKFCKKNGLDISSN